MLHLLLQILPVLCCRERFPDWLGPRNGNTHCLGVPGKGSPRLVLKALLHLRLLTLGHMGRARLGLPLVLAFTQTEHCADSGFQLKAVPCLRKLRRRLIFGPPKKDARCAGAPSWCFG